MTHGHSTLRLCVAAAAALFASAPVRAGQPLETETAYTLPQGVFEVGTQSEFQTSNDGSEFAQPAVLEYGIRDNLELLIEPVLYTSINPENGKDSTGIGDTEVTLSYRFFDETESVPALAIAGEIKFPTAGNDQIGTGKTDYAGYAIASKRIGKFDFHANAGFTVPGSPHGVQLDTTFNYAAAVEYHANDKWDLVAEVYGNTSSAGENADTPTGGSAGENTLAPEVSNGETVGSIGARYHFSEHTNFTFAVSADNNNAWIFAPGFTIKF